MIICYIVQVPIQPCCNGCDCSHYSKPDKIYAGANNPYIIERERVKDLYAGRTGTAIANTW